MMTVLASDFYPEIHLGGTARHPDDVIALSKLGLQFAEIPVTDPDNFQILQNEYRTRSEATGLYYLCHGPREGDPNNIETLEAIYFPKLIRIISMMPELEMQLLTFHLWLDARFVREKTIFYKIDFLKKLTEKAADNGITVCLENLSENFHQLKDILAAVPALNLTLDLGHAELLSNENTSFGFLDNCLDRIKHIHLHDNLGGTTPEDDLHLPVGEGKIDFNRIFQKIRSVHYTGTMTLELEPGQIESCLSLVKNLLKVAE